jgi:hypothetical protein
MTTLRINHDSYAGFQSRGNVPENTNIRYPIPLLIFSVSSKTLKALQSKRRRKPRFLLYLQKNRFINEYMHIHVTLQHPRRPAPANIVHAISSPAPTRPAGRRYPYAFQQPSHNS